MKKVVGFLSRQHGYSALQSLITSQEFELIKVYTHKLNPKSQDPSRSQRSDYDLFVKTCSENNIPLESIDSKDYTINNIPECDFLVEISWRYLIPQTITKQPKIGAFGIHRGKLPDYAGAEPIKQALSKGDEKIIISAHYLDEVIDQGNVIAELVHPVNYDISLTTEENIQRLRNEITPLFSKIMFEAFEILANKSMNKK